MNNLMLFFGGFYGALVVLLGAFGAHRLKQRLNRQQMGTFETGVRYQMYHALFLIMAGGFFSGAGLMHQWMGWCIIIGTFLFSFSIYGLVYSGATGKKWRFLGPVTPIGGLFLLAGWILFILTVLDFS